MICIGSQFINSNPNKLKVVLCLLLCVTFVNNSRGQELPLNPVSFRVFNQFVLNPAVAGSKDYLLVEGIASFQGKNESQLISAHTRIKKSSPEYFSSPLSKEFTNIGLGGFLFNDDNSLTRNIGFDIACSYHFPLNRTQTTFLSVGASFKGAYNKPTSGSPEDEKETWFPNSDFGIYYYSPRAFAGLSVVNILGTPENYIPVTREYFLTTGCRFFISKANKIVVEPSLLINTDDSLSFNFKEMVKPVLKIYIQNFCVGTYFHDYDNFSFFFQFDFPKFYIGTYFEYPRSTPFYKKELLAEVTLGISISGKKPRNKEILHW